MTTLDSRQETEPQARGVEPQSPLKSSTGKKQRTATSQESGQERDLQAGGVEPQSPPESSWERQERRGIRE